MNSTQRFSTRVCDYVKYRPSYPPAAIDWIIRSGKLDSEAVIADIGSGPGNLSRLFLEKGFKVIGVEPNKEMREAGEEQLGSDPHFTSLEGTAENTNLASESVDLITAAQAFHWFDQTRAKQEFRRVLRSPGYVALIWNMRQTQDSPLLGAYDRLLSEHSAEYEHVRHDRTPIEDLEAFFAPAAMQTAEFVYEQRFDEEGLLGRALSSSYVPQEGQPGHQALMSGLRALFEEHQSGGSVTFSYRTKVYLGEIR